MVMNLAKFKSILGGVVQYTVESGHSKTPVIVQKISERIRGFSKDIINPSEELAKILCELIPEEVEKIEQPE